MNRCIPFFTALALLCSLAPAEGKTPAAPQLTAEGNHVGVPVKALGREYLMSISVIPQYQAPTSSGLAGKIVVFEQFDDVVDMYESTRGLVTTDELPARRLLATFPVVERNKKRVVIDFNGGMRRVFTEDWIGGGSFSPSSLARVLEVPQSRVFSVKSEAGQVAIRQAVQARSRSASENVEQRMEIRYFLSPYTPGDFQSKENDNQSRRYVRFFETAPRLELNTGRPVARIARFDITRPVKFYYSANTPQEYVESVRDGVLYWNRAFGKEVVRCEKAPQGVTAPAAGHNIVQWVPWDSAGFAYADILLDPLSGESMHGQAYMTSVFAISGVARARLLLRQLRAAEKKEAEEKEKDGDDDGDDDDDDDDDDDKKLTSRLLGLPLFRPAASCQCDMGEFAAQYALGLEAMLADAKDGKIEDAAILRASQDYVCEVVAHEVGHVLGLRHNFAGSLAADVSPKELDEWFDKYLTEEKLPETKDKLTTSSVMEYTHFQSAVYSGRRIRTSDEPLPHDKAAIQWGYFGDTTAIDEKLLFGTDQDVGRYSDVARFDYGADPLVGAFADLGERLNGLPVRLVEDFVAAKAPRDKRDAIPLEQVNLDAGFEVSRLISDYRRAMLWFRSSARSLKVERQFDFIGPLNEEKRKQAHWDYLNEQVGKVGGVDRLGFSFLPLPLSLDLKAPVKDVAPPAKFDAKKLTEKVAELLDSDAYKTFVGADGEKHEFSDEERALIRKRAEAFFRQYKEDLLERMMQTWGSLPRDLGVAANGRVDDDDIVAKLEKQIIAAAKHVIMARSEETGERISGKIDKAFVEVVDFTYDLDTRLLAAKALADSAGSYPAWAKEARAAINKELKAAVESSLNIDNFKAFSDSKLSRPLRDWYLDQQRVIRSLPN